MSSAPASPVTVLDAYAEIFGVDAISRITRAASTQRGARVLHLTASRSSQHSRMVQATVPLMKNLGIDAEWRAVAGGLDDAKVAAELASALGDGEWSVQQTNAWRKRARTWVKEADGRHDVVIVHDPLLLPMRREIARGAPTRARWYWHCDVDLTDTDERLKDAIEKEVAAYSGVAFEHPRFAAGLRTPDTLAIPPAIDPLSGRNVRLQPGVTDAVLRRFDLDPARPVAVQVSAFDGWDDPLWAIYTFRAARKLVPGIQFVLVSTSTPTSESFLDEARRAEHPDVRMLTSSQAGDIEVNALQGASVVAVQNAVRKGFSSALLEASWKGRPVLAGDDGPLADQVVQGVTGFTFESFDDAALRIAQLVAEPGLADGLGFEGHRVVRDNHLIVRWVEVYLALTAASRAA